MHAYERGSEKLCEVMSSILNRNQKKVKPEDVKAEESESVQSGELALVKQKHSGMLSLPTMPWNHDGASQFTINFNFTGQ